MKRFIGLIGTYTCYYIGVMFCKIAYSTDLTGDLSYNCYVKFMEWSITIQDWAELDKPWGK